MRRAIPMLLLFGLCGLVVLQFAAVPLEQLQQPQKASPEAVEFGAEPAQQNFGYTPRPDETERFIRSLDKPTLREAAPELFQFQGEVGDEKPVLLYRALYEAHQQFIGHEYAMVRGEIAAIEQLREDSERVRGPEAAGVMQLVAQANGDIYFHKAMNAHPLLGWMISNAWADVRPIRMRTLREVEPGTVPAGKPPSGDGPARHLCRLQKQRLSITRLGVTGA